MEDKDFNDRFGSIYLNLKTNSMVALWQTILYFLRRLGYALSIVLLPSYPGLQYIIFMTSSAILLSYQCRVMPMDEISSQRLEIFNEATIFTVGALLAPYSASQFGTE